MNVFLTVIYGSNIGWPRKLTFDLEAEMLVIGLYMETSQCVLAHEQSRNRQYESSATLTPGAKQLKQCGKLNFSFHQIQQFYHLIEVGCRQSAFI